MEILLVAAGIGFVLFLLWAVNRDPYLNVGWAEKWPPISDDEFMARCTPGTLREVALKVRRIVSEQLGVPYDRVYPEQDFAKDLGCY